MEVGSGLGHDGRRTRPADVLVPNWVLGKPAAFDITVTSPLTPITLHEASVTSGSTAQVAENRKHASNDAKCSELGWVCVPLAVVHNKEKYLCHGLLLKLYLSLGLKVIKVHEMYTCGQSKSLAKFINFNIEQRMKASKENRKLDVTVAKLSNNAVYGKTMENVRKRVNVELVNGQQRLLR